jgi:hypothetical protein
MPPPVPHQIGKDGKKRNGKGRQSLGLSTQKTDQIKYKEGVKVQPVPPGNVPGDGKQSEGKILHIGRAGPSPVKETIGGQQHPTGDPADLSRPESSAQIDRHSKTYHPRKSARQTDGPLIQSTNQGRKSRHKPVGEEGLIKIRPAIDGGMEKISTEKHLAGDFRPTPFRSPESPVSQRPEKEKQGGPPEKDFRQPPFPRTISDVFHLSIPLVPI